MTAAAPLAATAVVQKKAAAAAPADSATAGVVAMSVAAAPAPGHERWAVGPLLRFASPTLEAAFQEDRSRRQGAAEMCWSTLAGAPSVLWELMQRPPVRPVGRAAQRWGAGTAPLSPTDAEAGLSEAS